MRQASARRSRRGIVRRPACDAPDALGDDLRPSRVPHPFQGQVGEVSYAFRLNVRSTEGWPNRQERRIASRRFVGRSARARRPRGVGQNCRRVIRARLPGRVRRRRACRGRQARADLSPPNPRSECGAVVTWGRGPKGSTGGRITSLAEGDHRQGHHDRPEQGLIVPCAPPAAPGCPEIHRAANGGPRNLFQTLGILERAKGFEPSTPTLARLCSTPELHPRPERVYIRGPPPMTRGQVAPPPMAAAQPAGHPRRLRPREIPWTSRPAPHMLRRNPPRPDRGGVRSGGGRR